MLKINSPLPGDVELLVSHTIACCIAVHRVLGPGLLERIYSRALGFEFAAAGISFQREKKFPVRYRGELLCEQHIDFVVAQTIVLDQVSGEPGANPSLATAELHEDCQRSCRIARQLQCAGTEGWAETKNSLA